MGSVRQPGPNPGGQLGSGPHTSLPRFGMALVRGRSMEPGLGDGDRLLVQYAAPVRKGRLVLARFADGTVVVKRAVEARETRTGQPGWWLLSDNPADGVDSRHRGVVAAEDVLGVVRLRLWPPGPVALLAGALLGSAALAGAACRRG